ncbi:PD-(D/E)XK motif protein [Microbispora sp. KK1-11]|uniref:PD-(D/E)XK motif protein n=1 Tax=Microbispora sp. KK1-11 TaxID=2053005 RepID=UPI001159461D|nr:PD-(D/E)XK motif protein [Microbispora sp. KK1-11]TQS26110.1 PD-(D/E)XK motif protein [Microbispora sp. KK1-11]
MKDRHRELIDQHWIALESRQVSKERKVRVSELPLGSDQGRLSAAVDHEGHRHILVPISPQQPVRRGLDGPVLILRKRPLEDEDTYQTYADLCCLRPDLNDLFTMLCADVLETIAAMPDKPLKALYRVLDRWKALFQTKGAPLGADQLAGLYGELKVLVRLFEKDGSAHRLWHGPRGHHHDFSAGGAAVEVKASTAGEGRRVRVHGLEQLDPPVDGTLQLVYYKLERVSDQGESVPELVDRALRLCDDEAALLRLLANTNYRSADTAFYQDVRFSTIEERWYQVGMEFPKLTGNDLAAAGIPIRVRDVTYTIDLSSEPPTPLGPEQVEEHLNTLLQESS